MLGVKERYAAVRIQRPLLAGGLAVLALGLLALWAAPPFLTGQDSQEFPWAIPRLLPMLRLTGGWFLFLGVVLILSALWPLRPDRRGPADAPAAPSTASIPASPAVARSRARVRPATLVLLAIVVVFTLAYGWMAFTRHLRFNSTGYDLAIGVQAIWNTAHGRPFATSLEVDNYLADHFAPGLLLLVPLYAACPSPLTLLGLQALVVGLGAIPVYRLARRRLRSEAAALLAAAGYALYPATGYLLRFDFHPEALAVPALLAAFDAMDEGRWKLSSVWLVIVLGCKEDLGLAVAALGLYALIVRRKATWGAAWLLVGAATFALSSFWLIPLLRGERSDTLARYGWLGTSIPEMAGTLLTDPAKVWHHVAHPRQLLYAVQLLLPGGYLALLSPLALLLAGPALAISLLSDSWPQSAIYFQYTAPIIPCVFIASILGAARLQAAMRGAWARKAVALALLPLVVAVFGLNNPFKEVEPLPAVWPRLPNAEAVEAGLKAIPPDASVVTTNNYAPHLAHRLELYMMGVPSQRTPPADPDAVLFNLSDYRFASADWYHEYLLRLDPQRYGVSYQSAGVVVIERDQGSNEEFRALLAGWGQPE